MGKNKPKKNTQPLVSLCTPTFNRRPFIPFMIKCFENQTYPKDKIEWIIVDDGTDPIGDLVQHIPQVKYFYNEEKMVLGKKRNFMHSKCSGDIIVYMDDDDYYPPNRISHAVEMLLQHPRILLAGSSEMHIYFDSRNCIYQFGPYKQTHATAGTFAFKKELLTKTKYDDEKALAEESQFTHNYTIPMVQLDTFKTILVFSHKHNTLNKEKLLETPQQSMAVPSRYTIDDFIKDPILKNFYKNEMNNVLVNYEPGRPENKPKVLEQIKQMEENRAKIQNDKINNVVAQQKIMAAYNSGEFNTNMETLKNDYEKKLSDKNILIEQLLKKVKELTIELNEYKTK
jgi:glycosyltransferase involved in cell wall biosynthesis